MLREQLEQAGLVNETLSQDIRGVTADWTRAREELEQKEADWRREEEVGSQVIISNSWYYGELIIYFWFPFSVIP